MVVRIKISLFDLDHVTKFYREEKQRQSRAEGRAEAEEKKARETAFRRRDMGYDDGRISKIIDVSLSKLQTGFLILRHPCRRHDVHA